MHAVVTMMDPLHYPLVEDLWRLLEAECGLTGIACTPIPHISWHIATEYDFKRLERVLDGVVEGAAPFTIRTAGLGMFTGSTPVVYIPVIKDMELARFHRLVWESSHPTAIGASSHYAPELWMPHITLAYGDVTASKLSCAVENLAFRSFEWEIRIDHLALVYQFSGQIGKIQNKFPFRTGGQR
jgi:2'-5' RNA ligase